MKKNKIIIFVILFISIFFMNNQKINASRAIYTSNYNSPNTQFAYMNEYGMNLKIERTNNTDEIKEQFVGNRTCGGNTDFAFNKNIPRLTSLAYNMLKIAVPIILIIKGMMDMFKAMSAGKEDEMKKAQKKFIQRLIAGICAFLVFIIVETIINWVAQATGNDNAMDCVNCFINGEEYCEVVEANNNNNNNSVGYFKTPFEYGVSYTVSSEYGSRTNPITGATSSMHYGIDLVAPEGTNILASADGTVVSAGWHDSMGNHVFIEHTYNGTKYYTIYMHMSKITVSRNQKVRAKQKIGVIGTTGDSTGVHLHLEISTQQRAATSNSLNPRNFINF